MKLDKSMVNDKFRIMVDSVNLGNLDKICEDFIEVGKIQNCSTNEDVMYVVYDKNHRIDTKHMLSSSVEKDEAGNERCVVYVRDEYIKRFKEDRNHMLFPFFHELGHFINRDFSNSDYTDNQLRVEYVEDGKVLPCELNADEFALNQLIQYKLTKDFILGEFNYMIQCREKIGDSNAPLAIKELELRKKHILQLLENKKI